MSREARIVISSALVLPATELEFRASRSGGPGGQHVNRSSTRVELWWNVARSPSLSDDQRARLFERLRSRLTDDGELRIVASETRSQTRNRDLALARFRDVVAKALVVPKRRKPTRPSRSAKEARVAAKKRQSERKRRRRPPGPDE